MRKNIFAFKFKWQLIILLHTILFFFHLNNLFAQDVLDLKQAWTITLKNNFTLQQQELTIQKAREEISIQRTDYYPSLSTSALLTRANFDKFPVNLPPNSSTMVGIDLFSLSLNQQIFSGFRTKNLVQSAQEKLTAQEIQKTIIQNTLLIEVGKLYYDIQENSLHQAVLKSSIDRITNQLMRVRNLYISEQATPFDTLEIATRKLQVENQLAILEDNRGILFSNLKYLLNEEKIASLAPLSLAPENFILDDLNQYFLTAMEFRPELKSISTQKRAQTAYSDVLKSGYYPNLSASLAFNYLKPTGDLLKSEWTNFYSLMVNFQWELWNWRRDAKKVQQAQLDFQQLDLQESQLVADIRHQIKVAYYNLQSAQKKIKLQHKLTDQEKERFRITEQRYEQGLATFLDLNSAELSLTEAETELHEYYITWYKNKLQLDYASGAISQNNEEVSNE